NWRWRWCLPAIAAFGVVALAAAFILLKSRDGMASASARLDYYITAVRIFIRHPFAGAGLGEFFPWYLRLKPVEAEITRDPHNILLSFMVQTGIFGLAVALLLLLFPWLIATFRNKSLQDNMLQISAITAFAAWLIHCLFQFNEIFPGTLFLAAASTVFIIPPEKQPRRSDKRSTVIIRAIAVATGSICLLAFMRVPGERLLRQGEIMDSQSPGSGLPAFVNATAKLPNAIMPPRASYDIYYSRGEWSKAANAAELLIRRSPHRSSSHQRLALAQLAMNDLDAAEKSLASALEWHPSSPEVLIALAVLQYRRTHSLSLMEGNLLAHQLRSCKAWTHDGSPLEVTLEAANNSLLASILKESPLLLPDGTNVIFQSTGQEKP
ncbi:MAG: O-antigen ligase family protein, partial [Victivallales bacterium]|nr:O-antigen ligase family protein [Victivallales bacterium]